MTDRRDLFLVQMPGWLLLLYLVYAQVPAAAVDARDAAGWTIDETAYWVVLPIIFVWALLALVQLMRASKMT